MSVNNIDYKFRYTYVVNYMSLLSSLSFYNSVFSLPAILSFVVLRFKRLPRTSKTDQLASQRVDDETNLSQVCVVQDVSPVKHKRWFGMTSYIAFQSYVLNSSHSVMMVTACALFNASIGFEKHVILFMASSPMSILTCSSGTCGQTTRSWHHHQSFQMRRQSPRFPVSLCPS